MNRDGRATVIGDLLTSGEFSQDAVRVIAYMILSHECRGDLEIFISEEIDNHDHTG